MNARDLPHNVRTYIFFLHLPEQVIFHQTPSSRHDTPYPYILLPHVQKDDEEDEEDERDGGKGAAMMAAGIFEERLL